MFVISHEIAIYFQSHFYCLYFRAMEKFNLYELNNPSIGDRSSPIDQNLVHKTKNYYENKSLNEHTPTPYEPYLNDEPQLNLVYEDDDAYANIISTGRNIPRNFQRPILQTNYFEEDSPGAQDRTKLRGKHSKYQNTQIIIEYLKII